MKVRAVAWLGIRTDRYAEMTRFCRDVLGLAQVRDDGRFGIFDTSGGDSVELFGPGAPSGPGQFDTNKVVAGFLVDDLTSATRELAAAGVELLGGRNDGGSSSWQHFRAPDGNVYELKEVRAGSGSAAT
jgi:glyoxylase I family protein